MKNKLIKKTRVSTYTQNYLYYNHVSAFILKKMLKISPLFYSNRINNTFQLHPIGFFNLKNRPSPKNSIRYYSSTNTKKSNKTYIQTNNTNLVSPFLPTDSLNTISLKKITSLNSLFKHSINTPDKLNKNIKIEYDEIINNPIFFRTQMDSFEYYFSTEVFPATYSKFVINIMNKKNIISLLSNIFNYHYHWNEQIDGWESRIIDIHKFKTLPYWANERMINTGNNLQYIEATLDFHLEMEVYLKSSLTNIELVKDGNGIKLVFNKANLSLKAHQMLASIINVILINQLNNGVAFKKDKKKIKGLQTNIICISQIDFNFLMTGNHNFGIELSNWEHVGNLSQCIITNPIPVEHLRGKTIIDVINYSQDIPYWDTKSGSIYKSVYMGVFPRAYKAAKINNIYQKEYKFINMGFNYFHDLNMSSISFKYSIINYDINAKYKSFNLFIKSKKTRIIPFTNLTSLKYEFTSWSNLIQDWLGISNYQFTNLFKILFKYNNNLNSNNIKNVGKGIIASEMYSTWLFYAMSHNNKYLHCTNELNTFFNLAETKIHLYLNNDVVTTNLTSKKENNLNWFHYDVNMLYTAIAANVYKNSKLVKLDSKLGLNTAYFTNDSTINLDTVVGYHLIKLSSNQSKKAIEILNMYYSTIPLNYVLIITKVLKEFELNDVKFELSDSLLFEGHTGQDNIDFVDLGTSLINERNELKTKGRDFISKVVKHSVNTIWGKTHVHKDISIDDVNSFLPINIEELKYTRNLNQKAINIKVENIDNIAVGKFIIKSYELNGLLSPLLKKLNKKLINTNHIAEISNLRSELYNKVFNLMDRSKAMYITQEYGYNTIYDGYHGLYKLKDWSKYIFSDQSGLVHSEYDKLTAHDRKNRYNTSLLAYVDPCLNLGLNKNKKALFNSNNIIDLVFTQLWSLLYNKIYNNFHYSFFINKGKIQTPGIKTSVLFSQILSLGRLYMFKLVKKLNKSGIKTVRLVTDGLTVTNKISNKYLGNKLGELKLENELLVFISYINGNFIQLNTNGEWRALFANKYTLDDELWLYSKKYNSKIHPTIFLKKNIDQINSNEKFNKNCPIISFKMALDLYTTNYSLFCTIFIKDLISGSIILIAKSDKDKDKEAYFQEVDFKNIRSKAGDDSMDLESYIVKRNSVINTNISSNLDNLSLNEEFRSLNPFKKLPLSDLDSLINTYYNSLNIDPNSHLEFQFKFKLKALSRAKSKKAYVSKLNAYHSIIVWLNAISGLNGKANLYYYYDLCVDYAHLKFKKQ